MFKIPSQQFTRHIDNRISKGTLQLKILRTWINIRASSLIDICVNITKRKLMEVPRKYQLHKTTSVHFEEHSTKLDHNSLISSFYLIFKLSIALIDID